MKPDDITKETGQLPQITMACFQDFITDLLAFDSLHANEQLFMLNSSLMHIKKEKWLLYLRHIGMAADNLTTLADNAAKALREA